LFESPEAGLDRGVLRHRMALFCANPRERIVPPSRRRCRPWRLPLQPCHADCVCKEWDEPPISAARWVYELIGTACGDDCIQDLAQKSLVKNCMITDGTLIVLRDLDIIIGSWFGKKFRLMNSGRKELLGRVVDQTARLKNCFASDMGPRKITIRKGRHLYRLEMHSVVANKKTGI